MTDFTANHTALSGNLINRALNGVWHWLTAVAENSGRARVLQKLSEMSDAELAAAGTTREEIVRKIFSDRIGL